MILPGQFCFLSRDSDGEIFYAEGIARLTDEGRRFSLVRVHNAGYGATATVNENGKGFFNRNLDSLTVQSVIVAKRPPFNLRDVNAALSWYHASREVTGIRGARRA